MINIYFPIVIPDSFVVDENQRSNLKTQEEFEEVAEDDTQLFRDFKFNEDKNNKHHLSPSSTSSNLKLQPIIFSKYPYSQHKVSAASEVGVQNPSKLSSPTTFLYKLYSLPPDQKQQYDFPSANEGNAALPYEYMASGVPVQDIRDESSKIIGTSFSTIGDRDARTTTHKLANALSEKYTNRFDKPSRHTQQQPLEKLLEFTLNSG